MFINIFGLSISVVMLAWGALYLFGRWLSQNMGKKQKALVHEWVSNGFIIFDDIEARENTRADYLKLKAIALKNGTENNE